MDFQQNFGLNIEIKDYLCFTKERKQFRFPKSKKVRIRKKWRKQPKNFRLEDVHKVFKVGNTLFVSSLIHEKLIQEYNKNARNQNKNP